MPGRAGSTPAGAEPPEALAGLAVVELGEGAAPAFCGKWLAAFGASVTRVELPAGDWMRRYHPFGAAYAEPGDGPLFQYLNTGKRCLRLDLDSAAGRPALDGLLAGADLLVHDFPPARRQMLGLNAAALQALNPTLVDVAISSFGEDGPYAQYAATEIVLLALGGHQYLTGEPGRPPLALPGFQAGYLSGLFSLIGGLAALVGRRTGGAGTHVELTALEVMASLHQFTISQYLYQRTIRSRHGSRWENLYPITLLACADGYLGFAITLPDQWERLCLMLGQPDLIADPRFATSLLRRANADALDAILGDWLKGRGKLEVFHRAQEEWRLPIGPLYDLRELLDDPQYRARGFWVRPDPAGPLQPGLPVQMSATPWKIIGDRGQGTGNRGPNGGSGTRHPTPDTLRGVRVLDFTRVWSGPLCTRILADLGAEVIKIEAPLSPEAAAMISGPTNSAKLNRNKLSLVLDLQQPDGRALVRRLVATADVLVENFSARVMPNFGLDYEQLRAINPALVMLAMPGFGTSGPYREYMAFGPAIEPITGLTSLLGYPGEPPLASAIAYPDPVAGVSGAAAILVALMHRQQTGEGQFIDLSQVEATTALLGEYVLACQQTGDLPPHLGNRHPHWAPQGTYRCRGEDQWISISVRSEAEWKRFCEAAGLPELPANDLYASAALRRQHHDQLDAAIAAWTRERDKFELMATLQNAGIPAGAVLDARELLEDPQLAASGFYVAAEASDGRRYRMPGTPFRFDGRKREQWTVAARRGEHGREILRDLLGLTPDELSGLEAEGVLRGSPP